MDILVKIIRGAEVKGPTQTDLSQSNFLVEGVTDVARWKGFKQ